MKTGCFTPDLGDAGDREVDRDLVERQGPIEGPGPIF